MKYTIVANIDYVPVDDLRKYACPTCKRKGLHYRRLGPDLKIKDFRSVKCRFCKQEFSVTSKISKKELKKLFPANRRF